MTTELLREYVEPLLDPALTHIRSIRFGTKALSYWPQRFVSDPDSDDLLRFFEEISASGRHVALMAHVSHPRELEPEVARQAIRRIRGTGAVIRTQAPLVRGVNDDPDTWATLWRDQVQLGLVPYYMFIARDTGAQHYFKVPLAEALAIYNGGGSRAGGGKTFSPVSIRALPGWTS
jgi:L-lysine 2,3-aminomutase